MERRRERAKFGVEKEKSNKKLFLLSIETISHWDGVKYKKKEKKVR